MFQYKMISLFISVVICVLTVLSSNVVIAATEQGKNTIVIEGEKPFSINFTSFEHEKDSDISGGDFLMLKSLEGELPPKEGFLVTYKVMANEDGAYNFDISSLTLKGDNGSPYEIKVNDGAFVAYDATNSTQYGVIPGQTYKKTFIQYHLKPINLNKGENTITFKITKARTSDKRYFFYLDCMTFTQLNWAVASVAPINGVVGVYEVGKPVDLVVNFLGKDKKTNELVYSVKDFWDKEVASGKISVPAGKINANIKLDGLIKGHYIVYVKAVDSEEGVRNFFSVVTPIASRQQVNNSPFALDAAMLFTYYKKPNFSIEIAKQYADVIALAGIKTSRERYRHSDDTNPQMGQYNFDVYNTDAYYKRLKENGINILNMFDSSPSWAKTAPTSRLTSDLFPIYKFAKDAANHFEGTIGAWEMGNEPELSNTKDFETADRVATMIKAAAIGYMDSDAKPTISLPGIAYPPSYYAELLMQNDVFPYLDLYNYHNHIGLDLKSENTPMLMLFRVHQMLVDKYGYDNLPVWMSEAGTYVPLDKGEIDLSYDKQVKMARYLATSTVTSLANGIDKHFYFNLTYYAEADRELGIFSSMDTPYAPYSAEAAITEVLGAAKYYGKLANLPRQTEAYVFLDKGDTAVAMWSDNEQEIEIKAPQTEAETINIMGNSTKVTANNGVFKVKIGPEASYFKVKGILPSDQIVVNNVIKKQTERTPLTKAQRVILEQKYSNESSENSKLYGYSLSNSTPNIVEVEVNNFNNVEMKGVIEGIGYAGVSVSPAKLEVKVAPNKKAILKFLVNASKNVKINTPTPIQFVGTFDGEKTSNCVANVQVAGQEKAKISAIIPGSDNPSSWQKNIAGGAKIEMTSGKTQGSVKFSYAFDKGDRWSYPVLEIPKGTDYRDTKGIMITVDADDDFIAPSVFRFMVVEENNSTYWTPYGYTLKKGVNKLVIPWNNFSGMPGVVDDNFHLDLDKIKMIRFGLNLRQDSEPPYTISDLGVYKGEDTGMYTAISKMVPGDDLLPSGSTVNVSASLKTGNIDILPDTIKVTLDGKKLEHTYSDNTISAKTDVLSDGEHKINVQYFCQDGRGMLGSSILTVQNSSALSDGSIFTDISDVEWAKESIEGLASRGIISGIGNGLFAPNNKVTRAEFTKMLLNAFKLTDKNAVSTFADVSKDNWYYEFVATAQKLGIVDGIWDNEFEANKEITREDMVALAYRVAKYAKLTLPSENKTIDFTDDFETANYAKEAIRELVRTGIINGTGNNEFSPLGTTTRAEASKIIYMLSK